MPQATEALREEWEDDSTAIHYLEERGYILTRQWTWIKPEDHETTGKENRAMEYLSQEWDYGGMEGTYK